MEEVLRVSRALRWETKKNRNKKKLRRGVVVHEVK